MQLTQGEFRGKIVFLENYDIEIGRMLVQGCDVWLNTPRRPLEASGTSGMKVPVNGGINISILDGWWCEGYRQDNGWAIGDDSANPDNTIQDVADAAALYSLLEESVVPRFFDRDEHWLAEAVDPDDEELHRVGGGALQRAPYGARLRGEDVHPGIQTALSVLGLSARGHARAIGRMLEGLAPLLSGLLRRDNLRVYRLMDKGLSLGGEGLSPGRRGSGAEDGMLQARTLVLVARFHFPTSLLERLVEPLALVECVLERHVGRARVLGLEDEVGEDGEGLGGLGCLELVRYEDEEHVGGERRREDAPLSDRGSPLAAGAPREPWRRWRSCPARPSESRPRGTRRDPRRNRGA